MAVFDEHIGAGVARAEGVGGVWPPAEVAPAHQPHDLRWRDERERARAEAAEAHCEELRWAEVESRARAGSVKTQLDKCRGKLKAAEEETKAVRHTAKNALAMSIWPISSANLRNVLIFGANTAESAPTCMSKCQSWVNRNRPNRTWTRRTVHLERGERSLRLRRTTTSSADDATVSLPWRARLRHADNCLRDSP